MTELVLNNFAAWSAQIAVLIAIGAIAALTLAPGRARLVFWQILLAIAEVRAEGEIYGLLHGS